MKFNIFILAFCFFYSVINMAANARDFIFMIDNSGSMKNRSHDVNRRIPDSIIKFARIIDKKYPNEDRIAIIKFDEIAETLMPLLSTEEIINDKRLEKAFYNMDYRGKWTIFNVGLNKAFNIMDNNSDEIYLIIISDGDLSQSSDVLKNDNLITDDAKKVKNIIKTKINSNNNINLVLIPFSKTVNYKYFKIFNSLTYEKDSLMEKVVKGKNLYNMLKSRFVYICADFPKGPVTFKMAILIDNKNGIFNNVFHIVNRDLSSSSDKSIKLRKVKVVREIREGLKWAWDKTKDEKIQAELMRKNRVNAICMIYANHKKSFKFRIVGCQLKESYEGYCKTRNTIGIAHELARQFKNKYDKIENDIINQIVQYDWESLNFQLSHNNRDDFSLEGFIGSAILYSQDNSDIEFEYQPTSGGTTNDKGLVTISDIPRGVPFKFMLNPKSIGYTNKPLLVKKINGGWDDPDNYPIKIDNNSENFPTFEILAYAIPDVSMVDISGIIDGNVGATVEYCEINSSSGLFDCNWKELIKIKESRTNVDNQKLLRGSSYALKATLEAKLTIEDFPEMPTLDAQTNKDERLQNNHKEEFSNSYPEDDTPKVTTINNYENHLPVKDNNTNNTNYDLKDYCKTTIINVTGGQNRIIIPFYLKIPEIITKQIKDGVYSGSKNTLITLINKFFDYAGKQGHESNPFRLSYAHKIFEMLQTATIQMDFSLNEKINLWGSLLETRFDCQEEDEEKPKTVYNLATLLIFLELIKGQSLNESGKSQKELAISTEQNIRSIDNNYRKTLNTAQKKVQETLMK